MRNICVIRIKRIKIRFGKREYKRIFLYFMYDYFVYYRFVIFNSISKIGGKYGEFYKIRIELKY